MLDLKNLTEEERRIANANFLAPISVIEKKIQNYRNSKTTVRCALTNEEYNAISKLTHNTKLDNVFDVISYDDFLDNYADISDITVVDNATTNNLWGTDGFVDFERNIFLPLDEGLKCLYESLAYPLQHDGLTLEESMLIVNLFKKFNVSDDLDWLLSTEELSGEPAIEPPEEPKLESMQI